MPDWMKHKLESRLQGEISVTLDMQMTSPLWQKAKRNKKSLLMEVKEKSESSLKLALNSTFKKLRSWHLVSSLHGKQMGKQWKW